MLGVLSAWAPLGPRRLTCSTLHYVAIGPPTVVATLSPPIIRVSP